MYLPFIHEKMDMLENKGDGGSDIESALTLGKGSVRALHTYTKVETLGL